MVTVWVSTNEGQLTANVTTPPAAAASRNTTSSQLEIVAVAEAGSTTTSDSATAAVAATTATTWRRALMYGEGPISRNLETSAIDRIGDLHMSNALLGAPGHPSAAFSWARERIPSFE